MKTIIAGGRNITNYLHIAYVVSQSGWQSEITTVVSGGAPGVDALGEQWAKSAGVPVVKFPADWRTYGKAAGPIRNEQMAKYADALILVWDGKSKGSASMKRLAQNYGLKIFEVVVT